MPPIINLVPLKKDGSVDVPFPLPEQVLEICQMSARWYDKVGYEPPWIGYLAIQDGECVGSCGFKTAPVNGVVEIAYGTFPPHEGKGIATWMAGMLIEKARDFDRSIKITAQTLPEKNASTTILTKLGFACAGTVQHPEDGPVWQWELPAQSHGVQEV